MSVKRSIKALAVGLSLLAFAIPVAGLASRGQPSPSDYAVTARLADKTLLLGGQVVGDKLLVAGSRGHILLSDDMGQSWQQAKVPTRVALTDVYFADAQHGWAVGHDAIILRTVDGGQTWERTHYAPEEQRPLLAVWFNDNARVGYAYGAYGYVLKSRDGGKTWENVGIGHEDGEPDDFHLNAIARSNTGVLYLAAEAGASYRSLDNGETWQRIYTGYEGSFFGALPLRGNVVLLFGLQGNVFRSEDAGASWLPIDIDLTATLNDGAILQDGTVVIVGNEGALLVSSDGGRSFIEKSLDDRKSIAGIIPTSDGGALLVGEMGARKLSLSELK